jgi:hypothetical protein
VIIWERYAQAVLYPSCFKIPEAAVNPQRRALGKRNNVKRLFWGEAYRLTGYGIQIGVV